MAALNVPVLTNKLPINLVTAERNNGPLNLQLNRRPTNFFRTKSGLMTMFFLLTFLISF